jgi:hypothetical protein
MRAATATIGILLALAAHAVPAARAAGPTEVELVSVTTSVKVTDTAPKGTSKGDSLYSTSALYNARPQFGRPKGARVGRDGGTIVILTRTTSRISVVAHLPGGTLTIRGTLRANGTAPVVAGTGRYSGATGLLFIKQTGKATALNIYRLTYALFA